jgi:DNA-directed RNA polymerase sigma subunit (sigma70/sigma32)
MNTASRKPLQARPAAEGPRFVFHPSFEEPEGEQAYGGAPADAAESPGYMPDDETRDCTKRMHYAAWRASVSPSRREATRWRRRYYDCRDRIVLGNRKLTYRAVQKWHAPPQLADDLVGECQLVLIKAVAAFNPWLGIRFSTYAFTCLLRALSRLSQRQAADRLSRWLPLGSATCGEPCYVMPEESPPSGVSRLDEYFRAEHTLLSPREKAVLRRRYRIHDDVHEAGTLEEVGRELGLSKERVRQLQSAALGKLRAALLAETPAS